MSLTSRIVTLAQAIGADVKTLTAKQGDLTSLSTTAKTNLVVAINEISAAIGSAGAVINDAATDGDLLVTWSADKIFDTIEAAKTAVKNDLINGASTTLDTLNELAAALGNDASFATTVATELGNRVRFDASQTLTALQQTQACSNIGVGEPETDLATAYAAAKA